MLQGQSIAMTRQVCKCGSLRRLKTQHAITYDCAQINTERHRSTEQHRAQAKSDTGHCRERAITPLLHVTAHMLQSSPEGSSCTAIMQRLVSRTSGPLSCTHTSYTQHMYSNRRPMHSMQCWVQSLGVQLYLGLRVSDPPAAACCIGISHDTSLCTFLFPHFLVLYSCFVQPRICLYLACVGMLTYVAFLGRRQRLQHQLHCLFKQPKKALQPGADGSSLPWVTSSILPRNERRQVLQ